MRACMYVCIMYMHACMYTASKAVHPKFSTFFTTAQNIFYFPPTFFTFFIHFLYNFYFPPTLKSSLIPHSGISSTCLLDA